MRAFSTLFVAVALALSANAAAIDKRDISSQVQLCINDINAVSAQLGVVKTAVDGFTSSAGYAGALAIHNKEQTLETLLKKAGTDCCVTPPTSVTDEEAQAVLGVVGSLVPQVTGSLSSISTKKSQFDAIPLATTIVKTDIKNLNTQTNTLNTCLLNKTPAQYLPTANDYAAKINKAFADTRAVYGI